MESPSAKTFHYEKGLCFCINKLTYDWTALENISSLKNSLYSRKYLHELSASNNQPFFYYENDTQTTFQNNILHMSICLPCFDEEWTEISGTIRSIAKNILHHHKTKHSFKINISLYIIQDGWNKASSSFKQGIIDEFGCPSTSWIDKTLSGSSCLSIFIPEGELFYPAHSKQNNNNDDIEGIFLFPIFITKFCNAQKFNSHLIFFSLCHLQKPDFVFLTDCGTIFNLDCIHELIENLFTQKSKIIAVTAKQQVMNQHKRRQIIEYPSWSPLKQQKNLFNYIFDEIYWWLSPAPLQGFEFESSYLLNISMFSLIKLLPVLPGPCQMIWWPHLDKQNSSNTILDTYFKHLNMDINNENLIRVNTILAEDRLLSFSLILNSQNLKTIWIKSATFYYEPMTSWVKLLSQRRRWINGTISTYLYYLLDKNGISEIASSGLANNKTIKFFWFIQLYQSLLQIFSPSFFSMAIYESTQTFFIYYPSIKKFISNFFSNNFFNLEITITLLYFSFYIFWVFFSMICGKCPKSFNKNIYNIFMEFIYFTVAIINQFISIFISYNIIMFNTSLPLILLLTIIWIIPLIFSLILSVSSVTNYFMYSIPFFTNIIQYVSFIPIYSFARIHDLSWGNRESCLLHEKKSYLSTTIILNFLSIAINFAFFISYVLLISTFGRNHFIYFGIYFILFFPIFIQIIMTILYFGKVTFIENK